MEELERRSDRERSLVDAFDRVFRSQGWQLGTDVSLWHIRSDLIVRSPQGHVFLIELKTKTGNEHFASVAEVAGWRRALANPAASAAAVAALAAVGGVSALLVTAAVLPAAVRRLADRMKVNVVEIDASDPDKSAAALLSRLRELAAKPD